MEQSISTDTAWQQAVPLLPVVEADAAWDRWLVAMKLEPQDIPESAVEVITEVSGQSTLKSYRVSGKFLYDLFLDGLQAEAREGNRMLRDCHEFQALREVLADEGVARDDAFLADWWDEQVTWTGGYVVTRDKRIWWFMIDWAPSGVESTALLEWKEVTNTWNFVSDPAESSQPVDHVIALLDAGRDLMPSGSREAQPCFRGAV